MVDFVRETILALEPSGPVVDLFAGMGTVAASLSEHAPIVANDALGFVACLSRARFLGEGRSTTAAEAVARLREAYDGHVHWLNGANVERLLAEQAAFASSDSLLADHMRRAAHVAVSSASRREARSAGAASGREFYRLTSLYFSSGYFTYQQANALDALRAAIDDDGVTAERDWLLSAWLGAASAVMNAPGHTAQFLFPRSHAAAERVRRAARLDVWELFARALADNTQVGSAAWRAKNRVTSSDALTLLTSNDLAHASVLYADPPYTRDQYSRFYHVYETMYRYDFPDARGQGRNRSDGFITNFSQKSGVDNAFRALFRGARRLRIPLIVSYPENGLLTATGSGVADVAQGFFSAIEVHTIPASHSTLGASNGSQKKLASEQLFVLTN
ncbi:DNA adenine methylase [Plantibacter sp. MPB07]|uniref:DNA adenine methylase n=1 Tax=Plantibacter sp. MPB07 TaxID=3388853 RepID=UPI003987EDB3